MMDLRGGHQHAQLSGGFALGRPSNGQSQHHHQAIRLSPLERHSSQLSLIYGPRPAAEETMLEQARRISLGSHIHTPPSR